MSTTDAHHQPAPKLNVAPAENIIHVKPRLPYYQINPSYTLRVVCCVLFIFLTEICLTHYIYRLINTEIRDEYLLKREFEQNFLNALRSGPGRDEFLRIFKEFDRYGRVAKNLSTTSPSRSKRDAYVLDDDNVWNVASDGPSLEVLRHYRDSGSSNADRLMPMKKGEDLWLTSHNRISLEDMQRFCANAKEYCPEGPKGSTGPRGPEGPRGPPGTPGPHGAKGERGDTGFPGVPGPLGARGHPGPRGEKGSQGRPGLDGRDGVPGEPGFDGIPGRNGDDGTPGTNGLPGLPGKDGRNGTDGRPGLQGPSGPPGPPGRRGLTGPTGAKGKPGINGTAGEPGVCIYPMKDPTGKSNFTIRPSIASGSFGYSLIGPINVEEGDNVTFHCAASGFPRPTVIWKRLDNQPIIMGRRKDVIIQSYTLNLTVVNRAHMGTYQCIADNGIPPQANQTFQLEVHFKPLIKIRNQKIGTYNGSSATLECEVEAYPEAVRYWERVDGKLLENGEKYRIENTIDKSNYRARMKLVITRINTHDFTDYYCIAKNEKTFEPTRGLFTVYEIDPGMTVPPSSTNGGIIFVGPRPPDYVPYESICPPAPQCTECLDQQECKYLSLAILDLIERWEIRPYGNERYTGFPNRTTNCLLYAIGKPVYHRFTNETYGSWMRDLNVQEGDKYWSTREGNYSYLFEFANKTVFRKDRYTNYYILNPPHRGNAHVVFNGSFFYVSRHEAKIFKYNMITDNKINQSIPGLPAHGPNLYKTGYNFMDLNIDDNGLWAIFGIPDTNNTGVMKMDPNTLEIQYIWNISLNHQKFGEMFIACGVLYAVDSVQDRNSKIRFALDLYNNRILDVNLAFTNPFKNTTTVGYNHKNKELYTWDRGNQLTYPVRCNEMSPHLSGKDERHEQLEPEAQALTGVQINNNFL